MALIQDLSTTKKLFARNMANAVSSKLGITALEQAIERLTRIRDDVDRAIKSNQNALDFIRSSREAELSQAGLLVDGKEI